MSDSISFSGSRAALQKIRGGNLEILVNRNSGGHFTTIRYQRDTHKIHMHLRAILEMIS